MPIFLDTFTSDLGWIKTSNSYVDSTSSISGGVLTITKGAGGSTTSAWTRTGFVGSNAVIRVKTSGGTNGSPEIHLRETDQNNFLVCRIDRTAVKFVMGKVVAGVYSEIASLSITNYTSALNYTFSALVFGNCFHATLWNEAAGKLLELEIISSDISAFTGTKHGLGHGYSGAGTNSSFDEVEMRTLDTIDNIVCLGNSNVSTQTITDLGGGAWSKTYDDDNGYPLLMQRKRLGSGMIARARGVSGVIMDTVISSLSTTLDPYKITGARNIVVLSCGNNNYTTSGDDGATCYADFQTFISTVKTNGWEVAICTIIPFTWESNPQGAVDFVDELNSQIRAGVSVDGFTLVEIWSAFGCDTGIDGVNPSSLRGADGIHYTTEGKALHSKTTLYSVSRNDRASVI